MRKIFCMVLTFVLAFGGLILTSPSSSFAEAEAGVIDVGNKVCPISGEEISGKHFTVYQGKRYGFCCAKCMKEFGKNPEKYLATLGESTGHVHEGHSH